VGNHCRGRSEIDPLPRRRVAHDDIREVALGISRFIHAVREAPRSARSLLFWLLLLPACTQGPTRGPADGGRTPSSVPSTAPSTPSALLPTSTPALAAEIVQLTSIGEAEGTTVMGLLRSHSEFGAEEIALRIWLEDSSGGILEEKLLTPVLPFLPPGGESPFFSFFSVSDAAASARVEVLSYRPTHFEAVSLVVDQLSAAPTSDGGLAVIGRIFNPGPRWAEIQRLVLAASEASGSLLGLSSQEVFPSALAPGAAHPFLARFRQLPSAALFTSHYAASGQDEPPQQTSLTLHQSPRIAFDNQGNPFVLGLLKNSDQVPRWAKWIVVIRLQDEVVGLAALEPWAPLEPGEVRSFAVGEFASLRQRIAQRAWGAGDLAVEAFLDPLLAIAEAPSPILLTVRLQAYESTGSRLFLRGSVLNPGPTAVRMATLIASLQSTEGVLQAAGEMVVAEVLGPGESRDFVLPVWLPRGVDLAFAEHDIRALGLPPCPQAECPAP